MNVKVKICGIRSLEIAHGAIDAGADFLGFNFVPSSKRYIQPKDAQGIIDHIKEKVKVVGVFQDHPIEEVQEIAAQLSLDYVQLHGNETPEYCSEIKKPVIKTIRVMPQRTSSELEKQMIAYQATYYLLDRPKQGEGAMIDTDIVSQLTSNFPIFLAGGLTPENIGSVLQKVHPFGVDISGGVETNGEKDRGKIQEFIKIVKKSPSSW